MTAPTTGGGIFPTPHSVAPSARARGPQASGMTPFPPTPRGLNPSDASVLSSWLQETATQLTFSGLTQLVARLQDNEVAVFYRNYHFSTIYKYDGRVFCLCTDVGYAETGNMVVWEVLDDIFGDTTRTDSAFRANTAIITEEVLVEAHRAGLMREAARNNGRPFPRYVLTGGTRAIRIDLYHAAPPGVGGAAAAPSTAAAPSHPSSAAASGASTTPTHATPTPSPSASAYGMSPETAAQMARDEEFAQRLQQDEVDAAAREQAAAGRGQRQQHASPTQTISVPNATSTGRRTPAPPGTQPAKKGKDCIIA